MFDVIETICDAVFEAVYICCWFSFLAYIFHKTYIQPLNYKQYLLFRSINKIRNIIDIDCVPDEELTNQLIEIQYTLHKVINKLNVLTNKKVKKVVKSEFGPDDTYSLPPQTHIVFPHFMIMPANLCKVPNVCLLSCDLSNLLGLDLGSCLTVEGTIKRFVSYIETNKLEDNDILILNSNLKQLFGIIGDDNINYKLKLSNCEIYLAPHLKQIHR